MAKMVKEIIHAKDIEIIKNWLRRKDIIEFLGLWEMLQKDNFKPVEFDGFKKEAGANAFTMSLKNG